MEVSLFQSQPIKLSNTGSVSDVKLSNGTVLRAVQRKTGVIRVPLNPDLFDALKSVGSTPTASDGSALQVRLTIGFQRNGRMGSKEGYLNASFVNKQIDAHASIRMTIDCIKESYFGMATSYAPVDSTYSFPLEGRVKNSFKFLGWAWGPEVWTLDVALDGQRTNWVVVCSGKLILSPFQCLDTSVSDSLALNRRLLTEELYCDVVVIANNKSELKFHRGIMAAHSSVFNAMFQSEMAEARTRIVKMPDMTEGGVRALRQYLYLWELTVPLENSQVCFELLFAGHKYDIAPLEKKMKKILLQKQHNWYNVDVALRLFLFVRHQEDLELKLKAVRVLKAKYDELKAMKSFKELFKKHTDAAMDLFECFAKYFH